MTDSNEAGLGPQLLNVLDPTVPHSSPDSTHEDRDQIFHAALVGNSPFDAFRNHFAFPIDDLVVSVAIGATLAHGSQRPHSPVGFVAAVLIKDQFTRRFVGARKQVPGHHAVGTCGQSFADIPRIFDSAVSNERKLHLAGHLGCIQDGRDLGDSGSRDHTSGADTPGSHAYLDTVHAQFSQFADRLPACDVTHHQVHLFQDLLEFADCRQDTCRVPMSRIHDDDIDLGFFQFAGPLQIISAGTHGCSYSQAAIGILGCIGIGDHLHDVFDGNQTLQLVVFVHHQQFFDAVFVECFLGLLHGNSLAHRDQIVLGHQLRNRKIQIGFKSQITVGENTQQFSVLVGNGNA